MQIQVQNITWNFQPYNQWDDDFLGYSYVGIPWNMLKRFMKECGWQEFMESQTPILPHYDKYEMEDVHKGSEHECSNTDTQIVLMNWLHDKRRNYHLDYRGEDPFWIFHDNRHSRWDVAGCEVNGITAYTEYQRILQGAEMAKDNGHIIKVKTAFEILQAWIPRFGGTAHRISVNDFAPFWDAEQLEHLEYCMEFGEYMTTLDYQIIKNDREYYGEDE